MDRLGAMGILVAAADAGSLSEAARRTKTPLPTVSRKIAELEEQLGARILVRTSRRLMLTEVGAAYVAACRQILQSIAEAERAVAGEYAAPKGELGVTSSVAFGRLHVAPIVTEFLQAYPDIDARLILTDGVVNLVEARMDVAVRIGDLPDSGLKATRVGEVRPVLCASPGYLAARGRPKLPTELAKHDCVTFEGLSPPDAWRFKAARKDLVVKVRSRLSVNTADAALDAAAAGLGITRVLSYQAQSHIRAGSLVTVLDASNETSVPVHLIRAGGLMPLKVRAFVDFAAPRLKQRLSG